MDVVLSAATHLEYTVANWEGDGLRILIAQDPSHGNALETLPQSGRLGNNIPAAAKYVIFLNTGDLFALCSLTSLVKKSVVSRDEEMDGIGTDSQPSDQPHNLVHGLLAGGENLILRAGLVPVGVDLILIHIDDLLAGKDLPQFGHLHGLEIIQLNTSAFRAMALQDLLAGSQIIA